MLFNSFGSVCVYGIFSVRGLASACNHRLRFTAHCGSLLTETSKHLNQERRNFGAILGDGFVADLHYNQSRSPGVKAMECVWEVVTGVGQTTYYF